LTFIAFCIAYNFSIPIFEGFDETSHYRVVDYYARHWNLPDLEHAPSHEAHQPPLYYIAGALLIAPIDGRDFDRVFQLNPAADVNVRQNRAVTDMSLLPHGTTLAVRLLRLFSTALGAATVLLTYVLATQLGLPGWTGLLAAALLAFNPKFIMLSASVSNDVATACLATLCLVLCARVMVRTPSAGLSLMLGTSVGLAALSKYSGLALGLPAALALLWSVHTHTHSGGRVAIRRSLVCGASMAAGVLLVCGWLFIYQWVRYGNPLAWEQVNALNRFARRDAPLSFIQIAGIMPSLVPTAWRVNSGVAAQGIGDAIVWVSLGLAAAGWVIGAKRKTLHVTVWILTTAAIVASVIALMPWMRAYGGTEDSRLLPAWFTAFAVLLAAGITSLAPSHLGRWVALGSAVSAAVWAAFVPTTLITPAFPPLAPMQEDEYIYQVPAEQVDALAKVPVARYDNGIDLASVTLMNDRLSPGEPLGISVVWRVTRPVILPYELTLEAYDSQNRSVSKWEGLPLGGRRSTRLWQVGDVYQEEYSLPIPLLHNDQPTVLNLYAGWHIINPPYDIARVEGSTAMSAALGRAKVRATPAVTAKPQHPMDARFGSVIGLEGYDVDGDHVTFYWRALDRIPADYQVFVHALDAQGNIAAQADAPMPLPSSLWDTQELVLDTHTVTGLAKGLAVRVGVYNLTTGIRLEASHADGSPWPDNSVVLWQR
jgi:hypothetical protein